uniref:Uncharacterized protein n=1 Tax=Cannabis sativa TaxID=3483 RepID=A0A803QLW0_CANSA
MGNMYLSKGVIVVFCIISLIACMSVEMIDGRYISYGAIRIDDIPGCSVKHPENCMKRRHPDNPYERDCLEEDHCRVRDPTKPKPGPEPI